MSKPSYCHVSTIPMSVSVLNQTVLLGSMKALKQCKEFKGFLLCLGSASMLDQLELILPTHIPLAPNFMVVQGCRSLDHNSGNALYMAVWFKLVSGAEHGVGGFVSFLHDFFG